MVDPPNPYSAPVSPHKLEARRVRTCCPVCDNALRRVRLVFPLARCRVCHRRIRLRSSAFASSLSTLTAIGCFVSLSHFEATLATEPQVFGIHALVFVALGTLWFHLFGHPALVSWFGLASRKELARERNAFRAEQADTDQV